jgi:multimeric flavodoxin WrbA
MKKQMKITAIVGSYRKEHTIDSTIDEILAAAKEEGAEISKIYLLDKRIEFCTNCRTCTQKEGQQRGKCPTSDDMNAILDEIESSNAVVLGSPMNAGTVTAIMKRFIERLVCYIYWPWGMNAPKARIKVKNKKAIIVISSAAPSILARLSTNIVKILKDAANFLGAQTTGVLFVGLAAGEKHHDVGDRVRKKARRLGKKLVSGNR